jgi:hypothetical protein
MSDDWAKKLGEKVKGQEADEQKERETQQYKARTIDSKSPALWGEIAEITRGAVERFNETVGAGSKQAIEYGRSQAPNSLRLVRSYFPSIYLDVRLDSDSRAVVIECIRHTDHDNKREDRPVRLRLDLDTNDNVYVIDGEKRLNAEGVAQKLLGYFA